MTTTVVNLRKNKYDVYIGRSKNADLGLFGNPFSVEEHGRKGALLKLREYFHKRLDDDPEFKRKVLALKGRRLGCFCAPQPCHGHIIAEYLEGLP